MNSEIKWIAANPSSPVIYGLVNELVEFSIVLLTDLRPFSFSAVRHNPQCSGRILWERECGTVEQCKKYCEEQL